MTDIPYVPLSDMPEGIYPLMVRRDGEWVQVGESVIVKEEGKPAVMTATVEDVKLTEFLGLHPLNVSIDNQDLYLGKN